jgi:hypothetical protein
MARHPNGTAHEPTTITHPPEQFASRAKRIRVRAEVNETLDEGALIAKYKEEISVLREQLSKAATMTQSPRRGASVAQSSSIKYVAWMFLLELFG